MVSGTPFTSAFTSRNSRFAFVFLAIVVQSFHIIRNPRLSTPLKFHQQGEARATQENEPIPPPFGSRSAETAATSAKSASWRSYHSSPFTAESINSTTRTPLMGSVPRNAKTSLRFLPSPTANVKFEAKWKTGQTCFPLFMHSQPFIVVAYKTKCSRSSRRTPRQGGCAFSGKQASCLSCI